ncbi:MAG TPA: SDR family oxidoreductase [Polyangiaceae bacterium]
MSLDGQVLVVGATGLLGMEIVRALCAAHRSTRAVVRAGTDPAKRAALASLGVETVIADLKDPGSLERACSKIKVIISTASATLSRQEGDSIQTVDNEGQLHLVRAAERSSNVKRFVYVSFPELQFDFELQRAKRRVEAQLRSGSIPYTILQPAFFMEVWLSSILGFDPARGRVRILGDGIQPISWISLLDVARFAVAAAEEDSPTGKVLPLGGLEALSPLQVVEIFKDLGISDVVLDHVPERALEEQLAHAATAEERAAAAIMLSIARGLVLDSRAAKDLRRERLLTVREYAAQVLQTSNQQ